MNDLFKDYHKLKNTEEKNKCFQSLITNSGIENMSVDNIKALLNMCFELFKINFECNNYFYRDIADSCEKLLNKYLQKKK